MKAKIKTTGEIIEVEYVARNLYGNLDSTGKLYTGDELDFNLDPPQPKTTTISGWVARDSEMSSNNLHFHRNEVTRNEFYWENKDPDKPIGDSLILPKDLFPSLTWDDEPIEVEITIKPKKQ